VNKTELIDAIVTSKTFTPDRPGNFSGGNVDIRTKSLPDARTFTLSIGTSFTPISRNTWISLRSFASFFPST